MSSEEHAPGDDAPVSDEELRQWLVEAEESVARYARIRRRALTMSSDERRQYLAGWGVPSITELDALARIAKCNVASFRSQLGG